MYVSEINPIEFLATLQAIETNKSRIQEAKDKISLFVNENETKQQAIETNNSRIQEAKESISLWMSVNETLSKDLLLTNLFSKSAVTTTLSTRKGKCEQDEDDNKLKKLQADNKKRQADFSKIQADFSKIQADFSKLQNKNQQLRKWVEDAAKYQEKAETERDEQKAITHSLQSEIRKINDEKRTLEIDNNKLREDLKSQVEKVESTGQENRPPTPLSSPTTQSPSALTTPTNNDSSNVAVTPGGTTEIVAADSDNVMKVSAAAEDEHKGDSVVFPAIMGSRVDEESFVEPSTSNSSNLPTPTRGCALVLDDLDQASIDTPVTRNADDSDSNDGDDDGDNMDDSGDVVDNMEFLQDVDLEKFSPRKPRKYRGTLLTTPTPRNVIGGLTTSSSSPLRPRFQSVASRHNKGPSFSTVTGGGGGFVTPARNGGFVMPVTGPSNSNSNSNGNGNDGEEEAIAGQQHQVEPNGEGNNLVQPTWEQLSEEQKEDLKNAKLYCSTNRDAQRFVDFSISDDIWNSTKGSSGQCGIEELNPQGEVATGVVGPVEGGEAEVGGQEEAIGGQHQVEPTRGVDSVVQPTWEELSSQQKASLTHIKCDLGIRDKCAAQEKTTIPLSDELWNSVPEDSDTDDSDDEA